MKILITPRVDSLSTFVLQPSLNPEIWVDDSYMRESVRERLLEIAHDFLDHLDLNDISIKDIIVTGSLANYNWSSYSDIDLHILLDFAAVDNNKDLVKRFFDAVRSNWNKTHDIRVKEHEVEIYVQDEHEPHTSTGVYSLENDDWIVEPKKVNPVIDERNVIKKATNLMRDIDKIEDLYIIGRYETVLRDGEKMKGKLKRLRQTGLERAGIFSVENLAFKVLRRSGHIGTLHDLMRQAYDMNMSLAEQ